MVCRFATPLNSRWKPLLCYNPWTKSAKVSTKPKKEYHMLEKWCSIIREISSRLHELEMKRKKMVNLHCAFRSCMQWLEKTSPIHVSKAVYIYEWIIHSGHHTPSNYTLSVTSLNTHGLQLHEAYYYYWWLLLMFFLC
jgi:hypothetical protein